MTKTITYFGRPVVISCDSNCEKAWGINNRPRLQRDNSDVDDYAFLSDHELALAPIDPGTYEGGDGKPLSPDFNKWCVRECERSILTEPGEVVNLPDFTKLKWNKNTS